MITDGTCDKGELFTKSKYLLCIRQMEKKVRHQALQTENLLVYFKSFTANWVTFLRLMVLMGLIPKDQNPLRNEAVFK